MAPRRKPDKNDLSGSGVLSFDGIRIVYESEEYEAFTVNLSDIVLIGEFTNDLGPFVDDWFLVFMHRSGEVTYTASMYAQGAARVREELARALDIDMELMLHTSTDYSSRVLWPNALAGKSIYTFTKESLEAAGLVQSIRAKLFPRLQTRLSPEVVEYLKLQTP